MADHLADLNKHLARLLQQSMKETDPLEYDKLGAEIWQVLGEQERLSDSLTLTSNNAASAAIHNSIGTVALAGSTTVTPAQTTTYTIPVNGSGTTAATAQATVMVTPVVTPTVAISGRHANLASRGRLSAVLFRSEFRLSECRAQFNEMYATG